MTSDFARQLERENAELREALETVNLLSKMAFGEYPACCPKCKSTWSIHEVALMLKRHSGECMCGKWSFDARAILARTAQGKEQG